jgi:hypothetical protein
MKTSQLLPAGEFSRLLRRKTLREDEIRTLRRKEVRCECGKRMPALRPLLAGYEICSACYEPGVFPIVIGGGHAEVGSESFEVIDV